jgi:hypothetical protein
MKRSLQFAPVITALIVGLGFFATPARAQRGARSASVSAAARPTYSQGNATHAASIISSGSRQSSRLSAIHSSPGLISSSQFKRTIPHRPVNPVNPVNRVPTPGYYWIFDGGTYWVPAEGDPAADQSLVEQANTDQMSGGQSVDSGDNGSQGLNASMQPGPADGSQSARDDSAASQSEAREEASASVPDEGQFTLVLNDGRWIEAVAFTHSNDTIVYITTAGSRYTIAANELDSDSTLRVNQERGTPLQSPL